LKDELSFPETGQGQGQGIFGQKKEPIEHLFYGLEKKLGSNLLFHALECSTMQNCISESF
jgi:hypothetical protein